jgi:hypothetical protein
MLIRVRREKREVRCQMSEERGEKNEWIVENG